MDFNDWKLMATGGMSTQLSESDLHAVHAMAGQLPATSALSQPCFVAANVTLSVVFERGHNITRKFAASFGMAVDGVDDEALQEHVDSALNALVDEARISGTFAEAALLVKLGQSPAWIRSAIQPKAPAWVQSQGTRQALH